MASQRRKPVSMRKIEEMLRLAKEPGISRRQIARSLALSHTSVNHYLREARRLELGGEEATGMPGSALSQALKGREQRHSSKRPQPDWNWVYGELKKKSVTLELLWQEYKSQHPDEGYQLSQFYLLFRRWKKTLDVSMRQTHRAGEKMFVDYAGQTIGVHDRKTGQVREAEIFVSVLGASNYTFAEATWDQSLPNWIESHIHAFEYYGGVSEITVPDNLKSGVSKACRFEPDLNPTYHEMALHYGTAVIPARTRKPKDKAKVEVAVQVVERWILAALRNRTFFSLGELNEAIKELLEKLNTRPFKKLEGSRRSCFESLEKEALKALPEERYVLAFWKHARVNIDYHVEIEGHYYSVPLALCGKPVEVRYTMRTVEIFCSGKRVASHLRSFIKGRHTTQKEHMPKSHQQYLEWTPSRILHWAAQSGEGTRKLAETILHSRSHPEQGYRSCLGILRLGKHYGKERLEAACLRALQLGASSYKSVRSILERALDKRPLENASTAIKTPHPNVRGSDYYQRSFNTDFEAKGRKGYEMG